MYEPASGRRTLPAGVSASGSTIRDVVHVEPFRSQFRLRFNNRQSRRSLVLEDVTIAEQIRPGLAPIGPPTIVRFHAHARVRIPGRRTAYSDPFDIKPSGKRELAVTFHVVTGGYPTLHIDIPTHSFIISGPAEGPFPRPVKAWYILDRIEARNGPRGLVLLGDSITAGLGGSSDARATYPERLQSRLVSAGRELAVLNSGINGGTLRALTGCFGNPISVRFDEDALDVPGVVAIGVLAGTNDLIQPQSPTTPKSGLRCAAVQRFESVDLTTTLADLVRRAHLRGKRIYLATIPPFDEFELWSPDIEMQRQRINTWIRTESKADGVFDFDAALRDPRRPARLLSLFDSGDGLHPNDAGASKMADVAFAALPLSFGQMPSLQSRDRLRRVGPRSTLHRLPLQRLASH